eukprot:2700546-Pleurochrysis_carterae.AAC.2
MERPTHDTTGGRGLKGNTLPHSICGSCAAAVPAETALQEDTHARLSAASSVKGRWRRVPNHRM